MLEKDFKVNQYEKTKAYILVNLGNFLDLTVDKRLDHLLELNKFMSVAASNDNNWFTIRNEEDSLKRDKKDYKMLFIKSLYAKQVDDELKRAKRGHNSCLVFIIRIKNALIGVKVVKFTIEHFKDSLAFVLTYEIS